MDRAEYIDSLKRGSEKNIRRENTAAVVQLIKTSVEMEKLTGSNEWNTYLEMVSGLLERATPSCEAIKEKLCSGHVVSHEELLSTKMKYIDLLARIETMKQLLEMPKQIIAAAKQEKNGSV